MCCGHTFEINLKLCVFLHENQLFFHLFPKKQLTQVIHPAARPHETVEVKPHVCGNALTRRSSWWKVLVNGQSILNIQGC